MKRFFTLFTTVVVFLYAHAQEHVYYLLPNSRGWNCEQVTDVNDNKTIGDDANQLKWEDFEWTTGNHDYSPERWAYTWFRGTYCDGIPDTHYNVRHVITFEDLLDERLEADGNLFPNVRVLWVNVDRKMTKTEFDDLFPTEVRTALANYVKAGGNLYLSTFASRLVWLMGRMNVEPGFDQNNDIAPGNENWYVRANFGQDNHEHAVYKYVSNYNPTSGNFPMLSGINHTDRNCLWTGDYSTFQTTHTCKVLGSWGHDGDKDKEFKSEGLVEFYPTGDWKGTIICNGLAACSFAPTNGQIANVQNLTKGILDYLSTPVSLSISVKENPVIKDEEYIGVTKSDNLTIISYASTNSDIADIHDVGVGDAGKIFYNYFGDVTFTVTAEGDGVNIPKNTVSASINCTVTGGDPATYGYVLTYSLHTLDAENLKPDYTAAKWFYDNYVSQGTGCFSNPKDYSSSVAIPSAIKVLWVHSDKWNLESATYYAAIGGDNFREALKNYIKAGGNAFLSKQATRLIGDIGRAKFYPCYEFDSECSRSASDTWYMTDDFKELKVGESKVGVSRHWHRAFKYMANYNESYRWPLVSAESSYNRTDHWYLWGRTRVGFSGTDTWRTYGCEGDCDFNQKGRLTNFESKQKCTILGGWGQTANLDAVGMAEFYPATVSATDFKGSVITMGLGAYQWTTDNTCANMAKLTKGVLEYLTDVPFVIHHNGDSEGDPREVNNYKETYAGGTIGTTIEYRMKVRDLNQWYSLSLPFTVSAVKVWDETDGAYYDLVPYYRTGGKFYVGHYVIRTPETATGLAISDFDKWNDPEDYDGYLPAKNTPYIIQWHDTYFQDKYISFFGASGQTIPTSMNEGSDPSSDNVLNVYGNNAMISGSVTGCYTLEPDYGGNGAWLRNDDSSARTVLPFECFIRAKETTRARYRVLRRGMTDTTTGIDPVSYDPSANANKVLINGQIVILRDNKMYNVMGMEVQQ